MILAGRLWELSLLV
uniref:Uncharacterized protein n=1 Tax=Anguilla anguilla TaxID=7936 RepID=A0A0E9VPI3_ANGAN